MSVFASFDEALDVGMKLLRLHRAAVGRDPGAAGLAALASAWRHGARLPDLAARLLELPEGRRVHGDAPPDALADQEFLARAAERADAGGLLDGLSRRDALAALAGIPGAGGLPALFLDCAPDDPVAYEFWIRRYERLPDPPLSALRAGLAMTVGDSDAEGALATLASLAAQTHPHWKLTVRSRALSSWACEVVERMTADPRVVLLGPGGSNPALEASGEAVCVLEPGDRLASTALACVAAVFDAEPETMIVYTDEDCMDAAGRRSRPRFKQGFSLDAALAGASTGRLTAFRARLLRGPDGPRADAAPFEARDLALRAAMADGARAVRHLPFVLCHCAEPALDKPPLSRPPARLPSPAPLVSVLLLTRDRPDLLRTVADGVLRRTDYPAIELVIVDHETRDAEAVALLDELARDRRVRVLPWAGAFNFAAMNNRAAGLARGRILQLLNNDVEIADRGWLAEMAAQALRPDVGAVGARLLGRDGTIQHAGMALGPGGQATHVMAGAAADDPGYLGLLIGARDVAAVTGACLAIRREAWDRVGGMDEGFPVAWNDVDLCQRVRAAGLRVIWTPYATLTHLEGQTRGRDADDPARLAAFEAARARYRAIWGAAAEADPFLNPNLVALEGGLRLAAPRGHGRLPWTSR